MCAAPRGSACAWTSANRREHTRRMNRSLLAALLFAASASADAAKPAAPTKPAATPAAATVSKAASTSPAPPTGQARPGKPVSMQGRDQVDPSVPKKYQDEVRDAQLQGALLQQEDFAVWVASNVLVESKVKAPGTATGWIAMPKDAGGQSWKVSFTADTGKHKVVYAEVEADITKPPPKIGFVPHAAGRGLGADEATLVRARDAISKNKDWLRCSDDYNYSVSFRQAKKGRETVVRALPARFEQKLYLLGGFHEFIVPDKSGKSRHFQQTNTCIELKLPPEGTGFVVSHLRSETPTQFHVFANLSYGRPVYVKIGSRTWLVKDGRISLLAKDVAKSLKMQAPPAQ